jgi:hypothetical protein
MSSLLVFNRVFRLEIQSVMLVFSTPLVKKRPCTFSLVGVFKVILSMHLGIEGVPLEVVGAEELYVVGPRHPHHILAPVKTVHILCTQTIGITTGC